MKNLILFTVLISLMSCKKSYCDYNPDFSCTCIEIYEPVCGCNDKTYSNSCHAECEGVYDYTDGACATK